MTTTNDTAPSATQQAKEQASEVASTAGDQAKEVAGTAAQAAGDVAGTAKQQAGEVVGTAVDQAQQLFSQTTEQLNTQASEQTQKLAGHIRELSDHFASMAQAGNPSSSAQTLVQQLAERTRSAAGYLEGKQPGDLLTDLQNLGRSRPGAFLLGAALAGLAVGRTATAAKRSASSPDPAPTSSAGSSGFVGVPPGVGTGVAPLPDAGVAVGTETSVLPGSPTVEPYPPTTPAGGR